MATSTMGRRDRTSTCFASKTSRFRRCFALFASKAAAILFSAFSRAILISSFFLAFLTCGRPTRSRRGHIDGVAATRSRDDAIAATALPLTRRTAPTRSEAARLMEPTRVDGVKAP